MRRTSSAPSAPSFRGEGSALRVAPHRAAPLGESRAAAAESALPPLDGGRGLMRRPVRRYRFADMQASADGTSLTDARVAELVRTWNAAAGSPATRTPAGYWKGLSVVSRTERAA